MKNIYLALLSQYSCKCKEALRTEKYHRALTLRTAVAHRCLPQLISSRLSRDRPEAACTGSQHAQHVTVWALI
jgi:hypothetical protein